MGIYCASTIPHRASGSLINRLDPGLRVHGHIGHHRKQLHTTDGHCLILSASPPSLHGAHIHGRKIPCRRDCRRQVGVTGMNLARTCQLRHPDCIAILTAQMRTNCFSSVPIPPHKRPCHDIAKGRAGRSRRESRAKQQDQAKLGTQFLSRPSRVTTQVTKPRAEPILAVKLVISYPAPHSPTLQLRSRDQRRPMVGTVQFRT